MQKAAISIAAYNDNFIGMMDKTALVFVAVLEDALTDLSIHPAHGFIEPLSKIIIAPDSDQLSSAIYLHLDHVLQVSLPCLEAVASATAGRATASSASAATAGVASSATATA